MDPQDNCVFIRGFGLANYRSFGPEIQRIGPCKKINLIIGQNNSGKSNVLTFLKQRYCVQPGDLFSIGINGLAGMERNTKQPAAPFTYSIPLSSEANLLSGLHARYSKGRFNIENSINYLLGHGGLESFGGMSWVDLEPVAGLNDVNIPASLINRITKSGSLKVYQSLCEAFTGFCDDRSPSSYLKDTLRSLTRELVEQPPKCELIPAFRQVGESAFASEAEYRYSGEHLIHKLADLQNPDHDKRHLKADFRRIRDFLREVTDRPDAELEVPNRKDTLNIEMETGHVMPLHALGTGIQEVVILAAAATTLHKQVVCIEEPELHLHPLLQKKLLRYLVEQTDNQYFITTHSAHLLDDPSAAIFHMRLKEGFSNVIQALEPEQRFRICSDLGYKASDIIQSNCIVWVEGPSDCIYLKEWLRQRDEALIEGVHYSIMFYGGRLLSHLTPKDPEVNDFISLRRLNRNMVVLMDSDRQVETDGINSTKQRIIDEWGNQPGFPWLTTGREIENYIDGQVLVEAQEAIAPKQKPFPVPDTQWTKALKINADGKPYADKIKVARWLVEKQKIQFDVPTALDLKARIEALHAFILESNHVAAKSRPSDPKG